MPDNLAELFAESIMQDAYSDVNLVEPTGWRVARYISRSE